MEKGASRRGQGGSRSRCHGNAQADALSLPGARAERASSAWHDPAFATTLVPLLTASPTTGRGRARGWSSTPVRFTMAGTRSTPREVCWWTHDGAQTRTRRRLVFSDGTLYAGGTHPRRRRNAVPGRIEPTARSATRSSEPDTWSGDNPLVDDAAADPWLGNGMRNVPAACARRRRAASGASAPRRPARRANPGRRSRTTVARRRGPVEDDTVDPSVLDTRTGAVDHSRRLHARRLVVPHGGRRRGDFVMRACGWAFEATR